MNRLHRSVASLVVVSISAALSTTDAVAQSQTPGQITKFDPSLNVVDSAITEDSSGNIGIGTTTPAAKLDVSGGNVNLENSTAISGNILKGGAVFMHNSGSENTFLGNNAGNLTMFGEGLNTGVGYEALESNTRGYFNTATGAESLENNTSGAYNTATGARALRNTVDGEFNTATGFYALFGTTSGWANTATGAQSLASNTTGFSNTGLGFGALQFNTSGAYNTAIGQGALGTNTTGYLNIGIGLAALARNTTGSKNTAVGYFADVFATDLTNATAIGAEARVDASNKIRLGNALVTVIEGQVPYTFTSDRRQKENFHAVDGEMVLTKLTELSLTSWNYIGHDPQHFRHYGPVAQEFFSAFGHDGIGTIGTPTTINSGDLEGILMIAVQALDKQNRELKTRIEALERLVNAKTDGVQ